MVALGLPLSRSQVFIDTLHPVYGGRGYYWQAARGETVATEYNTPTSRRLSKRLSRDHSGEVPDRTTLPNQSRGLGLTLAPLSRSDLVLWHETD